MIQSIERSAAILEIIAQEGGGARLQDIAAISGIGKTTAHNILQTLTQLGYVQRRPGDMRYHLGGRVLNLSRIAGDDHVLRTRTRPALEAIAKDSGATVFLGVPSGDKVAYLDILNPHDPDMANALMQERETLEGSAVGLVWADAFSAPAPMPSTATASAASRMSGSRVIPSTLRHSGPARTPWPFPGARTAKSERASVSADQPKPFRVIA